MKTIQVSTTNLLYYLTRCPYIKQKLLDEILPPLADLTDLVKELTYEQVMDFEYLQYCFNESLRIEPPASISFASTVDRDCTVG